MDKRALVIMLAIGAMAGAASFTHVHDVTVAHGQPTWIGWARSRSRWMCCSIRDGEAMPDGRAGAPVR